MEEKKQREGKARKGWRIRWGKVDRRERGIGGRERKIKRRADRTGGKKRGKREE